MAKSGLYFNFLRQNLIAWRCNQFQINLQEKCYCTKNGSSKDPAESGHDQKNERKMPTKKTENASKLSEHEKVVTEESRGAAKKKLLSLLSELKVEDKPRKFGTPLNLSKPLKRQSKQERFQLLQQQKKTPEDEIQQAVEDVARSISGDPEKTQVEITEKLITLNLSKETARPEERKEKKNVIIDEEINKNLMASVEEIASTIVQPQSSVQVKSKLTARLLRMSLDSKSSSSAPRKPINSLVKSMKFERKGFQKDTSAKESFATPTSRSNVQSKINMFQSAPLDIFQAEEETITSPENTVWQSLEKKNLQLSVQFAPASGFEEMIMWTETGKHWKFPIDNETEMGNEENVGFHEHVFLEQHLDGFPTKGPVRHFMELVVVGLSKNPYITVDRKIENINWFRDYFKQNDKKEILQDYGALE